MKIEIGLRDKFGRDAVISFSDASVDDECFYDLQRLRVDLEDLVTVFGGLVICVIQDRVAEAPNRHGILEEIMDLLERYSPVRPPSRARFSAYFLFPA